MVSGSEMVARAVSDRGCGGVIERVSVTAQDSDRVRRSSMVIVRLLSLVVVGEVLSVTLLA
jgi:hypothetical protein